jgi:hypothetical protein
VSLLRIHKPSKHDEPPITWDVVGDLRRPDTDIGDDNYLYSTEVTKRARTGKIKFEEDPESSCCYFYCETEAGAKRIVEIADEVALEFWSRDAMRHVTQAFELATKRR